MNVIERRFFQCSTRVSNFPIPRRRLETICERQISLLPKPSAKLRGNQDGHAAPRSVRLSIARLGFTLRLDGYA
jgi:hypothetical protein